MTRTLLLATAATFTALAASADEVRVYNWSDYIDEALLEKFEAETGIDLIYDVFDSNELLETKMLAGGSGYDVVVPTGTFLARQIQAGVFQKLDKSKLPNIDNLWPQIMQRIEKVDPLITWSSLMRHLATLAPRTRMLFCEMTGSDGASLVGFMGELIKDTAEPRTAPPRTSCAAPTPAPSMRSLATAATTLSAEEPTDGSQRTCTKEELRQFKRATGHCSVPMNLEACGMMLQAAGVLRCKKAPSVPRGGGEAVCAGARLGLGWAPAARSP